jgi:hypothetical protein
MQTPAETSSPAPTKEFFRLPKGNEKDPIFELRRTTYLRLEKAGAIKFARVHLPGRSRGSVLVDTKSVRGYLAAQVETGRKSAGQ